MVHALRITAVAIAAAAFVIGIWSLPWNVWFGEPLATLPDAQTDFVIRLTAPFWLVVVPPLALLLIKVAGVALVLMGLAHIVERLEIIGPWLSGPAGSVPRPPDGSAPLRHRLVRPRVLRVAAIVVFIAWVAQPAYPFLWRLATGGGAFHDTYFVAGANFLLLPALVGAAFALITLALAAIVDRLDRIGARSAGNAE